MLKGPGAKSLPEKRKLHPAAVAPGQETRANAHDENLPPGPPFDKTRLMKQLRYPILIGKAWRQLPPSIQERFAKYKRPRETIIYKGRIQRTTQSTFGHLLARLARLIGSPLTYDKEIRGPATVIVRESDRFNGQYWTRIYPTAKGTPQVIQTQKIFEGPTGLIEMISPHLGVELRLTATREALIFSSSGYFFKIANVKIQLPRWLSPGIMTVTHRQTGPKRFRFTLELTHRRFGELFFQTGIFEELER